nr:hypothetical protein [Alysiella crassa]UOP06192.1 hypothetical protein LVJ80_10200 [Alysiella crassa]
MSETELKFAKRAIAQIAQMGGEHTRLLLEYIKLFSCKEAPLTLEQTYGILMEVDEFWKIYPADAWQIAVQHLLEQRESLNPPLENHALLIDMMELIVNFENSDDNWTSIVNAIDPNSEDLPINTAPPPPPIAPPKSPDPPPRTEQQKAQAAKHIKNMRATLNKCHLTI